MEFQSLSEPLPHIPDDVTVPQFIFDSEHELRPKRGSKVPWLIDDETGRKLFKSEVCQGTYTQVYQQVSELFFTVA